MGGQILPPSETPHGASLQWIFQLGDPLTGGPLFEVEMPNGFTYHLQETAFFSWFYNQVPSLGINGWYSSNGSFTRPADLCR